MATTRFIDHLLEGDHASRPAANAVPEGTLYSCTTHTLIYQSDGTSTWSTWFTGATGMTDPMTTRGDIIIRNASNVTARLGRGGAGTVLSSDGTDVSWQTPAGSSGSFVWLQRQTASSSATLDFTSFMSSTYDVYEFVLQAVIPATNAVDLYMLVGTGGGPTYATADYSYADYRFVTTPGSAAGGAAAQAQMIVTNPTDHVANTSTKGINGTIRMFNPLSTAVHKFFKSELQWTNSSGINEGSTQVMGWAQTTALTAIRFSLSGGGNISSGTIDVYGLTHA